MRGRPPEDDRPASSRRNDLEKKRGRGLQKSCDEPQTQREPRPKLRPPQLLYRESPWAFVIRVEPLENGSGSEN